MRIINTVGAVPTDTLGQLAWYNGFDNLALPEIHARLSKELDPIREATYRFEIDLQAPLLEMSFNGIHTDAMERARLIGVNEQAKTKVEGYLHTLLSAIGYYEYYRTIARARFACQADIDLAAVPRTWADWVALPIATRKELKAKAGAEATKDLHKWIKQLDQPFNADSNAQKMRLFYHFFGHSQNQISRDEFEDFPPPWNKTHGISEYKTRNQKGEYTPSVDRDCLEKLRLRANGPVDAAYWALPFISCCLAIADYSKSLQFLRCKLENGMFRSSFATGPETGRLSSRRNAQGYGWNSQNVAPPLRTIFTCLPGWKMATPDYEQIESRNVGAICFRLFGATAYLDACQCGDLHTLVCSMIWPDLPWPEEFTIDFVRKYGVFPSEIIKAAKKIANEKFYRNFSRRDLSKRGGHGCLTADHEVLTPFGWQSIATVSEGLPILAWNQHTNICQWEVPTTWTHKAALDGLVSIEGRDVSMLCSLEHRIPLFGRTGKYNECTAAELLDGRNGQIKKVAFFTGGDDAITTNQARLCAAAQADAHIYPNGAVRWGFSKERKIERLLYLLEEEGISPKITEYPARSEIYIHLSAGKVTFPTEKYAGAWMLGWPREALQAWVEEQPYWDGTKVHNHNTGQKFTWIYGKHREHMSWLALFAKLTGQGASYCANDGFDCARVGYNREAHTRTESLRISYVDTTAIVHCPTVPSSGFVCRRNGKIMFSLNSNYLGKPPHMAKMLHVETSIMQHYQDAYFEIFPEIPQWHKWVVEQVQSAGEITTFLGRKRQFFGRPSDDATIREAVAFEPQSIAADYTNSALLALHKAALYNNLPLVLFLQKHDEIGFRYLEAAEAELLPKVRTLMEQTITLTAPDGSTREWRVPTEMQSGWNLGKYNDKNPDGVLEWTGNDPRTRTRNPFDIKNLVL